MSPGIQPRRFSGLYLSRPPHSYLTGSYLEYFEPGDSPSGVSTLETLVHSSRRIELRLDVDGPDALRVASGRVWRDLGRSVYWIAPLKRLGRWEWRGHVDYVYGLYGLWPPVAVKIVLFPGEAPGELTAHLTATIGGTDSVELEFKRESEFFRKVRIQIDREDVHQIVPLSLDPTAPTGYAPAEAALGLPNPVSLEQIFGLVGVDVDRNDPVNTYDAASMMEFSDDSDTYTAPNGQKYNYWTDGELHGAMEAVFRPFGEDSFVDRSRWSMWVFYAQIYEPSNKNTWGMMFDEEGHERQGAAIFQYLFDGLYPPMTPGNTDPKEWSFRHKFFTTIHEMGHGFNLAHCFSKTQITPWRPMVDDPDALTFMNYANTNYSQAYGEQEFFEEFLYRFTKDELLFLRHAPEPFVQMGNAAWSSYHGYGMGAADRNEPIGLTLGLPRSKPIFEFMEPVYLDLQFENRGAEPVAIDPGMLNGSHGLVVLIRREGGEIQRLRPLVNRCEVPEVLGARASTFGSVLASIGGGDWIIAAPGNYTCQAFLQWQDMTVASNQLRLRVLAPQQTAAGRRVDAFACDYFSREVGRILALQGSRSAALAKGEETLRELVRNGDLGSARAALHARYLLGRVRARPFRRVSVPALLASERKPWSELLKARQFEVVKPDLEEARENLLAAFDNDDAFDTFGRVEYFRRSIDVRRRLQARGIVDLVMPLQERLEGYTSSDKTFAIIRENLEAREARFGPGKLTEKG